MSNTSHQSPRLPGTQLRIVLPEGTEFNLASFIEVSSPSETCLLVRIPVLTSHVRSIINTIKQAGGAVEVMKG